MTEGLLRSCLGFIRPQQQTYLLEYFDKIKATHEKELFQLNERRQLIKVQLKYDTIITHRLRTRESTSTQMCFKRTPDNREREQE